MHAEASAWELAQVNIALPTEPLDSPRLADFVSALDPVNAEAETADGFRWRLVDDSTNAATAVRGFGDDRFIINMSTWRDVEALRAFVYGPTHVAVLRRRREWFTPIEQVHEVCWWVPAGHHPTVAEAEERAAHLAEHGAGPTAFPLRAPFPPPGDPAPLSPTRGSTPTREKARTVVDRRVLHEILEDALIGHVGLVRDGRVAVLPVAFAVDLDGPDREGTLYLHGSVAANWFRGATADHADPISVTFTELDGLVAARSGVHHSMNYRCAMVHGRARAVTDPAEKARALDLTIDHMIPDRAGTLRPPTRKEDAKTAILAIPLFEASVKVRAGDPNDEPEDVEAGVWGGVIPIRRVAGDPVPSSESERDGVEVPSHVVTRAHALGSSLGH